MTDVETTGLDPSKHEILEIGLVVFGSSPPFEIVDTLDIKVKPEHIETAEPRALEVNGYDPALWIDSVPLPKALELYYNKARGCTFASHNVTFDWGFIGNDSRFSHHKLDTVSIAWAKLPHDKVKGYGLKTLCNYLGIEPEPVVHHAINGAMKAYELYVKLMTPENSGML